MLQPTDRVIPLVPQTSGTVTPAALAAGWPRTLAVSPGLGLVAAGYCPVQPDGAGFVQVWNASDGAWLASAEASSGALSLAFSPDGRALAVGSLFGADLWRPMDASEPVDLPGEPDMTPFGSSLSFTADGTTLGTLQDNGEVLLWPLAGADRAAPGRPSKHPVIPDDLRTGYLGFAFNPDGSTATLLVRHGDEGTRLTTWNPATGEKTHRDVAGDSFSHAYSPDGRTIATAGDEVQLWDAKSSRGPWAKWAPQHAGTEFEFTAVHFTHSGTYLLASSWDGGLYLFTAKDGKPVTMCPSGAKSIHSARFLPNDTGIAYCGATADGRFGAWLRLFA